MRCVERSSSGFQYNDYDNWNTNTNVSSHLCKNIKHRKPCQQGKKLQTKLRRWYRKRRRLIKAKAMKRIGNLYNKIISIENLNAADAIAQKGKSKQYGVQLHNKNKEANILKLH